ncbi:uncharacterized protein LOC127289286 [Leptopilina boulardi]|uniref:uncharacterized protein LOC127289286 n=1 Tax=Leptopilina boulardi TaxID=63433 RepID=UPI0021F5CEE8|nr:uncharacterized protein LOC127289286 [Leptopilina boulardi]
MKKSKERLLLEERKELVHSDTSDETDDEGDHSNEKENTEPENRTTSPPVSPLRSASGSGFNSNGNAEQSEHSENRENHSRADPKNGGVPHLQTNSGKPGTQPAGRRENANETRTVTTLKKYDRINDEIYLGRGILLNIYEWDYIKDLYQPGPFVIALAEAIWKDGMKDMCLNLKKAKPRSDGQVRKAISKRKILAMEELYRDKISTEKNRYSSRINNQVKIVKTTLTHAINDRNKKKKEKQEEPYDSSASTD